MMSLRSFRHRRGTRLAVLLALLAAGVPAPSLAAAYTGDSAGPSLKAIAPLPNGNTAFTNQRIIVHVAESDFGIDPATIKVSLADLTDSSLPTALSASLSGSTLRSAPTHLIVGHRYRAGVELSDYAGHRASLTIPFNVFGIDPSASTVKAVVPRTASTTWQPGTTPGTRTFSLDKLPLNILPYKLHLRGASAHPGFGYVASTVDLGKATIHLFGRVGDAYQELPTSPIAMPSWGTRHVLQQFFVTQTTPNPTFQVAYESVEVPGLTIDLPATVDRIAIDLKATASIGSAACADPTACAAGAYPTPDPLPFYLDGDTAQAISDGDQASQDLAGQLASNAMSTSTVDTPCTITCLPQQADALRWLLAWNVEEKAWGLYQPDPTSGGVTYEGNYPLYAPENYDLHCLQLLCGDGLGADAPTAGDDVPATCPEAEGSTDYRDHQRKCSQWVAVKLYFYNDACCGDPLVDGWFTLGQVWYYASSNASGSGYGVSDGTKDKLAWGINKNPTPSFDLTKKAGNREYVISQRTTCNILRDATVSAPSESTTGEAYASGWSGAAHTNLRQYTRSDVLPCLPNPGLIKNRLQNGAVGVWMKLHGGGRAGYHPEHSHKVALGYGHNKTSTNWSFGCGPSFSYPPSAGYGCGWTPQAKDSEVWSIHLATVLNG